MSDIREAMERAVADLSGAGESVPETPSIDTVATETTGGEMSAVPESHDAVGEGSPEPARLQDSTERTDGRTRDANGRFAPKTPTAKPPAVKRAGETLPEKKAPVALEASGTPPARPATPTPAPGTPAATEYKAPQSWKPSAREKWQSLPPELQQEIARVDREAYTKIQEGAEARKFQDAFRQAVAPYEWMVPDRDHFKALGNLYQTAATLKMGSVQDKAHVVASIINGYGVPLEAINTLLAGPTEGGASGGTPPPPGQSAAPAYRDTRVDQLFNMLAQAQQQRERALVERSRQEVEAFGREMEFFEDVRDDMAMLVREYDNRGIALSLKDAYSRAVMLHPEIVQVLRQREAAEAAKAQQASTQRARMAASSVKSQPVGSPQGPTSNGVRGALEAAAAALSRR